MNFNILSKSADSKNVYHFKSCHDTISNSYSIILLYKKKEYLSIVCQDCRIHVSLSYNTFADK